MMVRYRYRFQNIGIELWLYNHTYSLLFLFDDYSARENIFRSLREKAEKLTHADLS